MARCVRKDGTAYGTGGQCRKGREEALSQRVGKGLLAKAPTEKLQDYLNRAPHQYQRDAIKAELDRRAGAKRAPSVPTELKKELAALGAPPAAPAKKEGKPSQKINARMLREANTQKLEEYLKREIGRAHV